MEGEYLFQPDYGDFGQLEESEIVPSSKFLTS